MNIGKWYLLLLTDIRHILRARKSENSVSTSSKIVGNRSDGCGSGIGSGCGNVNNDINEKRNHSKFDFGEDFTDFSNEDIDCIVVDICNAAIEDPAVMVRIS